jgi:hypothetical protein
MLHSRTYIPTALGSRYLQQLCKHWGHKLEVEFTPEKGQIRFDEGRVCRLAADEGGLQIEVEAGDAERLARTERVVFEHLKRFAFKENLEAPEWKQ